MRLFLCEKPSQAKSIAPHVGARVQGNGCLTGPGVTVTWAFGHLLGRAAPEYYRPAIKNNWKLDLLPVIPEHWMMEVKDKTRGQYAIVSKLLPQASEVVIATDADREGEVVAREIMELNGYRGPVSRLWLSAFDDASIRKALARLLPGEKTLPMYHAGMGRGRADWLAGMNLTMALSAAFGTSGKGSTLHCGRVQTPVLALIVRRERAIAAFVPKTHYQLAASFLLAGREVPMAWQPDAALLDNEGHVVDRARAASAAQRVAGKIGRVSRVETTPERESAPLPYSLGALQREASARFGMKAKAVLDAAQALYEKHKATTYPRTDCEHLPQSMIGEAQATLEALALVNPELKSHAQAALQAAGKPTFAGRAFNDRKITAHHAIIPTQNRQVRPQDMGENERIVYDMIVRRYLAQFLGDHEYLKTVIEVDCESERFRAAGKSPTVPGWRALYPQDVAKKKRAGQGEEGSEEPGELPPARQGEAAPNVRCEVAARKTQPPKRYTEGTLLAAMESIDREIEDPRLKAIMRNKEKAGIGTDATRSDIIENMFRHEYIEARKKELHPTAMGSDLIALVEKVAPEVADPVLTAQWEDQLAQIEKGQLSLGRFEGDLSAWLVDLLARIKQQAAVRGAPRHTAAAAAEGPKVACPACGKPMRRIEGSKGPFWGCTGFREGCKNTLPDVDGKPGPPRPSTPPATEASPYRCPKCHKPLRRVPGPSGYFWGCSGYPQCRHTQPDEAGKPGVKPSEVMGRSQVRREDRSSTPSGTARAGEACPQCGQGVLINKTLKDSGRAFIGCNRFPVCRFFAWAGAQKHTNASSDGGR